MKTCLVGCGGIAAVHGSVLTSGIDTEFVAGTKYQCLYGKTACDLF